MYPLGNIYLEVGHTLNITCSLNITSKEADGKNSSALSFDAKFNHTQTVSWFI